MEKELKFKVGKVSSKAKEGSFATSFEVAPQDSQELSRGVLLAVVAISASEKFDAEAASRQVLAALKDNFYSQTTGGILVALERAVNAAHQRLLTIVFSGGDESAVDFDLVAGVLWGSVFYLAQLGNGKAVIRRGGKLRLIGHRKEVDEELSADVRPEVRTASGLLEEGDVLVLGTPKFFEAIKSDELEKQLGHGSVKTVTDEIKGRVSETSMVAGLVLAIGEDREPENEEIGKESEVVAEEKHEEKAEPEAKKEEAEVLAAAAWGGGSQLAQVREKVERYLGKTRERLGPAREKAGERAQALGKRYGQKDSWKMLVGKGRALWDKLGRPRTALEGVDQARNRRTLLALAGALLVILLIGVLINNMVKGSGKDKGRFDNLVSTAQGQYDEAQQAQANDKARAQELLASASGNLKEAGSMHIDDKKVSSLLGKIGALQDSLAGVVAANPGELVDLTTLRSGAQGAAMAGNGKSLYVLDGSGALYSVGITDKKGSVLSSDVALKHGSAVALAGNSVYSFVQGEGIYSYNLATKKFGLVSAMSSTWGKIVGMVGYQSFLYLLDSGKSMIWRYSPGTTLGSATTWLKSGSDLSSASSIVVDGSVWVGGKGTVSKFVQGGTASFGLSGAPQLGEVKAIYTSAEAKNLYLLDAGKVVVVSKSGQYVNQYKSDKLVDASGLFVDEVGGKAYVLAGGKVYEFDLK